MIIELVAMHYHLFVRIEERAFQAASLLIFLRLWRIIRVLNGERLWCSSLHVMPFKILQEPLSLPWHSQIPGPSRMEMKQSA